jgi:hypothetical protein
MELIFEQKDGTSLVNSFHVMAVNKRPLFGLYYSEGHVLLRHNTTSFKGACRFIYLIEAKVALYGPHLHCEPGQ